MWQVLCNQVLENAVIRVVGKLPPHSALLLFMWLCGCVGEKVLFSFTQAYSCSHKHK